MIKKVDELNFLLFLKSSLILSFIVILLLVYPMIKYASGIQIYSVITGYVISFLNSVIGFYLSLKALKKSLKSFMLIIFGGMGIRLIVLLTLILILYQSAKFELISLMISVLFFYMLFTTVEIYYINKTKIT